MCREDINKTVENWLLQKYPDIPKDVTDAVKDKKLGFAISTAFDYKVVLANYKYHNIQLKQMSTQFTPVSTPVHTPMSPLAVPLQPSPLPTHKSKRVLDMNITDKPAGNVHLGDKVCVDANLDVRADVNAQVSYSDKLGMEIKLFQTMCNRKTSTTNVDYSDLDSVLSVLTFKDLCDSVRKNCPTLTEILESLVDVEESESRELKLKTECEKLLRAIHAQACLVKLANQKASSYPLFFGILLVSFGCGEGKLVMNTMNTRFRLLLFLADSMHHQMAILI